MALADALHGLLRLPGATYSCVVERDTGRVLAEVGHGESGAGDGEGVVPYSVARWGTAVAAMFDSTSGDGLDDVMITGRRSYHLVRPLGATASVLVYLRLDRARSNLAAARRELAVVRWGTGAAAEARTARMAAEAARPVPRPGRPGDDAPAARASPDATPDPAVRPTPDPAVRPTPGGPARRQPGTAAEDAARAPRRAATETKPESTLSQIPLSQIPLPRRAPATRASEAGGRRRAPGWPSGSGESAPPAGFAVPAVLGQSWADDPGTLRRLIAGLRRMS